MPKKKAVDRDTVFVPGGQPSITYIDRKHLGIERDLARAIAMPNQIISLSGPSKSGKTVLCRHVLGDSQYLWIEGGQTPTAKDVWDRACYLLNFPLEVEKGEASETGIKAAIQGVLLSFGGSQLLKDETKRKFRIDSMSAAIQHLVENRITLIIDDFHYLDEDARIAFIRNIRGPVFDGLRVVLLSIAHRAFDATKAERELTGRFQSVIVPDWDRGDLLLIPQRGFQALGVECSKARMEELTLECQSSPSLMQRFCWDVCFEMGVLERQNPSRKIPRSVSFEDMFARISKDAGLPVYQKLVAGPQNRRERMMRPLRSGGEADVYEATLAAIALTGPQAKLSYNELRSSMTKVLADNVPQKHEVTAALKQLAVISRSFGKDAGLDWDESNREINVGDPYLRFYLRWQIGKKKKAKGGKK